MCRGLQNWPCPHSIRLLWFSTDRQKIITGAYAPAQYKTRVIVCGALHPSNAAGRFIYALVTRPLVITESFSSYLDNKCLHASFNSKMNIFSIRICPQHPFLFLNAYVFYGRILRRKSFEFHLIEDFNCPWRSLNMSTSSFAYVTDNLILIIHIWNGISSGASSLLPRNWIRNAEQ